MIRWFHITFLNRSSHLADKHSRLAIKTSYCCKSILNVRCRWGLLISSSCESSLVRVMESGEMIATVVDTSSILLLSSKVASMTVTLFSLLMISSNLAISPILTSAWESWVSYRSYSSWMRELRWRLPILRLRTLMFWAMWGDSSVDRQLINYC